MVHNFECSWGTLGLSRNLKISASTLKRISHVLSIERKKLMKNKSDPRRQVGALVHTTKIYLTSHAKCSRVYGSISNAEIISMTIVELVSGRSKKKVSTSLVAYWSMKSGAISKKLKFEALLLMKR